MSTYNFHGSISGQSNFGDHGRIEVHHGQSPAEALRLAGELVRRLRAESPGLAEPADLVRGELARADAEGRSVDRGRVRQWLELITTGVAAGSGSLALAQDLGRALGM
ncbi:hypothetical protein [Streptomyces abikoensis]|uniref:hypothetical protein n=1 Tax=Streptomyces abikoensis TaxID=97398 RepID=UPI0016734DA3|nr:hypothetical protein [Streptomyces abikoensis]GGP37609.1 hypothetical protein GCM10010214_08390 [Streptomyces abikoensis]